MPQDPAYPEPLCPLSAPAAIVRRRATRHYDPNRPIDDELLKTILRLATYAPSGYNLQPWRFIVVRSLRNREKLRACAFGQPTITEAPVTVIVLGYHSPHQTDLDAVLDEQLRLQAITRDVVPRLKAGALRAMERVAEMELWVMRSTMPAVTLLMIAAESLGVSSTPIEGFEPEKLRQAFGIPDDHSICCLVTLGHALSIKPFPGRFALGRVCHEEHFGQPWTLGETDLDNLSGLK
jgi:nitroreductase